MIVFAKKNFQSGHKRMYVFLITLAIYFRAILAFLSRLFGIIQMPLIDAFLLLASLLVMKYLWIRNVKTDTLYSPSLLAAFFSSYILIWIATLFVNGAYDKPYKPTRLLRGMLIGSMITLALYGLLNEHYRFSRGITVLGALSGTLLMLLFRRIMQALGIKNLESADAIRKVMIVGTPEEEQEIRHLLNVASVDKNIIGAISPLEEKEEHQLGIFPHTPALSKLYQATEIIFVQQHLGFSQIIDSMQACGNQIEYKIHSVGTNSIIGSNSKNTAGDLYTTEQVYKISTQTASRNKRIVDVISSLVFLLGSPVLIWFVKNRKLFLLNMFLVLEGDKTMVGYYDSQFPRLKSSLLDVYPIIKGFDIPAENKEHLNWLYAKNYDAWDDVRIIWDKWRML